MADNYLEKQYEAYMARKAAMKNPLKKKKKKTAPKPQQGQDTAKEG